MTRMREIKKHMGETSFMGFYEAGTPVFSPWAMHGIRHLGTAHFLGSALTIEALSY